MYSKFTLPVFFFIIYCCDEHDHAKKIRIRKEAILIFTNEKYTASEKELAEKKEKKNWKSFITISKC